MTCIVACSNGKNVWIGGDSAGVAGGSIQTRLDPKVFSVGPIGFGFTDSFRMGNLLRYKLNFDWKQVQKEWYTDIDKFMNTTFVDRVIAVLRDNGYARIQNNVICGGTFIVGLRGQIYCIYDDFQVGKTTHPYWSIGSGQDLALGSLYTSNLFISNQTQHDMKRKITLAIEAASKFSSWVCEPINIIKV